MRRIRELVADVANVHPKDSFIDRFEESCRENPAKRRAYRSYDDALRLLDSASWQILKSKAIAHFRDHRQGQLKQGFFNQLNEAFAYRHLVRRGFTGVRMLPEDGRPVPDLRYRDGREIKHCEVKTISISDEEISRRESSKVFTNAYVRLEEGFFRKLASDIVNAKAQITTRGTEGLVYVVVVWDDIALDYYKSYRKALSGFACANDIDDVHIKVGLRFNRRMSLAGFR